MGNRIIKETICESKSLAKVSFFAEDLYKRLLTYADDYGRFNADCQVLRARLYPREVEIVTDEDIEDAMTELIGAGKIAFYTSEARDEIYGCFPKWAEHQRLRDSKRKIPDPSDTTVNDWYLRRFIPMEMKKQIIERDGFKCQECGKFVCAGVNSADRLIKMGFGLFHIDHIVPVAQGGRATKENLRLLCPECNLRRQRKFTPEEILELSQQLAANGGEMRPSRARAESNPIQSNPNPNPNPTRVREDEQDPGFTNFWNAYPRKSGDIRQAFMAYLHAMDLGATPEKLVEAIKTQTEGVTAEDMQFMPSAEKWLRNRGWESKGTYKRVQRETKKSVTTAAEYKAPTPAMSPAEIMKLVDQI